MVVGCRGCWYAVHLNLHRTSSCLTLPELRADWIMKFPDQDRSCDAEPIRCTQGKLREASVCPLRSTFRCAQGDNTLPILIGKNHYLNRKVVL